MTVTVVAEDPAWAEVWSKVLFLEGEGQIKAKAEEEEIAALWVDEAGELDMTQAMHQYVIWRRA